MTERTQIHFLNDVLVAVASLDLKVPNLEPVPSWVVLFWLYSRRNRKGYFKQNSKGSCWWGILTQQF